MIVIYLFVFVIFIVNGTTKNSSTNHVLVKNSCVTNNNNRFESLNIPSDYHYYFHFSNQSSSFLSLLALSYCEHQQTTYYSSSGFAILRSSPRFLFTDIVNSQLISSFRHHNAVLSVLDQSLSTTINTLMSTNENNLHVDNDYNNSTITTTTTTINSLLPKITTTAISNVSLFHTSLSTTHRGTNRTFNITLIIGCSIASIILIIVIIYAFIKYRNRDEGSYKIDESKNFIANTHIDNHDNGGCVGKISSSNHNRQKILTTNEQNGVDSREWYV